jgi:hypothetical protein
MVGFAETCYLELEDTELEVDKYWRVMADYAHSLQLMLIVERVSLVMGALLQSLENLAEKLSLELKYVLEFVTAFQQHIHAFDESSSTRNL